MHLLLSVKRPLVVGETVVVLRQLLQQNSRLDCSNTVLTQLVKLVITGVLQVSAARCSAVWLIGEFYDRLVQVSPDLLRILAQGFLQETTETKQQILNFAIKLALRLPADEIVQNLMQYILEMSRYDTNTDLRDRSRFSTALMGLAPQVDGGSGEEEVGQVFDADALEELHLHAQGIMLSPKLPPVTLLGGVDVDGRPSFTLGSLSSLMQHNIRGYIVIPPWRDIPSDTKIRDVKQKTNR